MLGLLFSQVILFLAAILMGFAIGWRAYIFVTNRSRRVAKLETEQLRAALTEAQVRRARMS